MISDAQITYLHLKYPIVGEFLDGYRSKYQYNLSELSKEVRGLLPWRVRKRFDERVNKTETRDVLNGDELHDFRMFLMEELDKHERELPNEEAVKRRYPSLTRGFGHLRCFEDLYTEFPPYVIDDRLQFVKHQIDEVINAGRSGSERFMRYVEYHVIDDLIKIELEEQQ